MATEQLIEHAERVMVVRVRLCREIRLLYRVFPIPGSILEEHNSKYHMDCNGLSCRGMEVRVVVEASELSSFSLVH